MLPTRLQNRAPLSLNEKKWHRYQEKKAYKALSSSQNDAHTMHSTVISHKRKSPWLKTETTTQIKALKIFYSRHWKCVQQQLLNEAAGCMCRDATLICWTFNILHQKRKGCVVYLQKYPKLLQSYINVYI